MKIVCNVSVGNRILPGVAINPKRRHVKSTLALCKKPKSETYCIILFSSQNKHGTKYEVNGNILKVLTRFLDEGKTTIQFKEPPHDLYIQTDSIQLKGFLHLLKRVLEGKILPNEVTLSSMTATPVSNKNIAPTKLTIKNRSEYPMKGFPRTLEELHINDIKRCSLDRGILNLKKLKILDLSNNCIEYLPEEINQLPSLSELNLSFNEFSKSSPKQWNWMGEKLSNTLKLLNLSNNELKYLPEQLVKLHNLITLRVDFNQLKSLPSGIGNLMNLRVFTASNNQLSSLPGSVKKWHLEQLDLSNNTFNLNQQSNPSSVLPKPLPISSLKEYAARKVLLNRLPYSPSVLPLTLIKYLDLAKYCVCGLACFDIYFKHTHMLLLSSVSHSFSVSAGLIYVPIDCYFCSLKCFTTANYRSRQPVI